MIKIQIPMPTMPRMSQQAVSYIYVNRGGHGKKGTSKACPPCRGYHSRLCRCPPLRVFMLKRGGHCKKPHPHYACPPCRGCPSKPCRCPPSHRGGPSGGSPSSHSALYIHSKVKYYLPQSMQESICTQIVYFFRA